MKTMSTFDNEIICKTMEDLTDVSVIEVLMPARARMERMSNGLWHCTAIYGTIYLGEVQTDEMLLLYEAYKEVEEGQNPSGREC